MPPKNNDYDDLETDYLEEENESGFLSLISVIIAFVAVAVFIALAWYAYQSNTGDGDGDIEVVYAEEGLVREAPEETGGWQFPHQDKSVYGMVQGKDAEESSVEVEQVLPAPEEPAERPAEATKTWMNEKLKAEPIAQTEAERELAEKEGVTKETPEAPKPEPEEVAKPEPKAEPKKPEPKKPEPVKATPKPVPVASPAKAPVSQAQGNVGIQLGAVRSETDARAQWGRIQGKFGGVLAGKGLRVQSAEIPGKGTFYRIQATGFASRGDAAAACNKLSSSGQACFVVGK